MGPCFNKPIGRWCGGLALILLISGCIHSGGIDLAPKYAPAPLVMPAAWQGDSPFVPAQPADDVVRKDWWKLFDDDVLNQLEEAAMAANPDLQAAAERFIQARDTMMQARSKLIPHLGLEVGISTDRVPADTLFLPVDSPLTGTGTEIAGLAAWEPDFWSKLRNQTRVKIYRAQQSAAEYALARLSIQAELASDYFTLRGLDAQNYIFHQSIEYYKKSLEVVNVKFAGHIAGELDVARAEYQLSNTQARQLGLLAKRQVVEHAIAVLVNQAASNFSIPTADHFPETKFAVPAALPSTLLQRRPDVAAMERKMAQANRSIGIARSAFFPNIPLGASLGVSGGFVGLFNLPNILWSLGTNIMLPLFEGGYRRAQLQKSWSAYRETENLYRATVLNAIREVENGLSLTKMIAAQSDRQNAAVAAATKQQNLSMDLYKGSLASSLELINAQVNTIESRITAVDIKASLLRSEVGLVRSLGGGFDRSELPSDDAVAPMGIFQYTDVQAPPKSVGGIEVHPEQQKLYNDLTKPLPWSSLPVSSE